MLRQMRKFEKLSLMKFLVCLRIFHPRLLLLLLRDALLSSCQSLYEK